MPLMTIIVASKRFSLRAKLAVAGGDVDTVDESFPSIFVDFRLADRANLAREAFRGIFHAIENA
jgi:hypothetical protein